MMKMTKMTTQNIVPSTPQTGEPSFKCPNKTLWMECSLYHEVCLSLKFKTEEEREAYTLIFHKNSKIKEQFPHKLTALQSDKHSLQENTALWPLLNGLEI